MTFKGFLLILVICKANAAPTDGPIRIELEIPSTSDVVSRANQNLDSLSRTAIENAKAVNGLVSDNLVTVGDALNSGLSATTSFARDSVNSAGKVANEATALVLKTADEGARTIAEGAESVVNQHAVLFSGATNQIQSYTSQVGIFEERPRKLESAILETESLDSKTKSITENLGNFVAGIFQPKPIVDTITEEEKYGNNGDKFAGVGRALVSGSESVANLLSQAVQFPVDFLKSITRKTTSSLNNLGSKLIGL